MENEKMTEVIFDAVTNEVTVSELSPERIAEIEADREVIRQTQQAKDLVRNSALAKLAALGLTEEEIGAL